MSRRKVTMRPEKVIPVTSDQNIRPRITHYCPLRKSLLTPEVHSWPLRLRNPLFTAHTTAPCTTAPCNHTHCTLCLCTPHYCTLRHCTQYHCILHPTNCTLHLCTMHHCPQCYCTPHLSGHNKSDRHESQHSRSAAKIVKLVPAEKLKSTLDSVYDYHGVEQADHIRHRMGHVHVPPQ